MKYGIIAHINSDIIAPGRVGRSANKGPWSTFGIFDTEERSYQQVYLNLAS